MTNREGVVSAIKVTFRNHRHSDPAVPVDIFLYREKPYNACIFGVQGWVVQSPIKVGVHMKTVFQLGIKLLMQISRLRFKQSRISLLIPHIYVLGRCVNFWGIFR